MNIKEFIKNLDIQTYVEIGAHFGTDTLEIASYHPTARIVCFEPDPRNIKILKQRKVDLKCELVEKAVGAVTGKIPFFLSSGNASRKNVPQLLKENDWSASSSLKKPTGHLFTHPWISFGKQINVDCIRLDDYSPLKNVQIDFIWMDVQGAEDLVFQGAQKTLENTKYIYTEYCNQELYEGQLSLQKILTILGDRWKVVHDFGGDVLLINQTLSAQLS
jgi:FkbM family methyltransferase